jgi:ubiquinone/menaquinone biosynthesis C-methylase UbiE
LSAELNAKEDVVETHEPDTSAIKERQQKTWTSGNYAMVGNLLVIIGEQLCEAVDLRAGDKVLDVATGSGNTALSAARRFCEVTGVDYVPELIEQARSRAEAERLAVQFEVGDAEIYPTPTPPSTSCSRRSGLCSPRTRRGPPESCFGSAGRGARSG